MLETRNLSVSYGQHRALEGASVRVDAREIVVILGANGAGKSTLLKAICGICEGRVSGEILMDDIAISGWTANRIVEQGIALVPEGRGIFPELTVQENLKLGAYTSRAREDETGNLDRVFTLFPKLRERRRQVVRTMSGGEQQMVAVSRAMMSNPQILALDEPSLGLSPMLCRELFQSLKFIRDAGVGILLVEQNAKQSLAIADRGYLLENAMIIREDSARTLISDHAVQKAYLGAAGAAAPAMGTATPAASPTGQRPVQPVSAPRPPQASPADIAAAAMKSYSNRSPDQDADSGRHESPLEQGATAQRSGPPPFSPPTPRPGGDHGIEIEELVARAREKSAETVSRRTNGFGAAAGGGAGKRIPAPQTPPATRMPDLGDSADRLRAVLREIEEAAARARNYRPPGQKG